MKLSRRTLLKTIGGVAAVTPFVPLLDAVGPTAPPPHRLIIIYSPDGIGNFSYWTPNGSGSTWLGTGTKILAPLNPFQSHVMTIEGLDNNLGGGHPDSTPTLLTARPWTAVEDNSSYGY